MFIWHFLLINKVQGKVVNNICQFFNVWNFVLKGKRVFLYLILQDSVIFLIISRFTTITIKFLWSVGALVCHKNTKK